SHCCNTEEFKSQEVWAHTAALGQLESLLCVETELLLLTVLNSPVWIVLPTLSIVKQKMAKPLVLLSFPPVLFWLLQVWCCGPTVMLLPGT
ncbi:mCG59638, partial [Mus musculus]